ncbi:MAG TPA: potassium transporter TrkA [Epsilonproteobacteria bacterium]|nr:potassium transporter TrkA [Campylobacterota bacterium]
MSNNSFWLLLQKMRAPFIVIVLTHTIAIAGLVSLNGVTADGEPYKMTIFDAFYFISYTATTIGFGETPYSFTYPQRMWVSASIYITVIGWFYGIGSLISTLQDKLLIQEIAKTRFRKKVRNIREDFFIILGYNNVTKKIIGKVLARGYRVVVIEKNTERVNELILENYVPNIPVLQADIYDPNALELAGIKSRYCKGLVSLFEDDNLNLKIALTAKILNQSIPLAIKSTTNNHTENLQDLGVEIIENPFNIISNHIQMLLNAPTLYQVTKWVYRIGDLHTSIFTLPKGLYIICGYGRMGKQIHQVLANNNLPVEFIEIDNKIGTALTKEELKKVIFANADDKEVLKNAKIEEAVAIIAGTNDDTTNLSLLATARKINPHIVTIARENEIENLSLFHYANIHYIFMPSRLLIHKTINALIHPMADKFLELISTKDEQWAQELAQSLREEIGPNPDIFDIKITENDAYAIAKKINSKEAIYLDTLLRSRANHHEYNRIKPLLLWRNKKSYLLPQPQIELQLDDEILFACNGEAIEDIEYIAQNDYELEYILKATI